ncbi:hypothetical protein MRB53_020366 [Persea americana]|uniref:Uncharacterized protein n=1 Tax=Persea americana TaxID=3435 RepID=A0ACC2L1Z3_PERAE|nr:hypothetical protein MRB53_020366 [Persea americana]
MDRLSYRKINFEEFCAAATSPYRLEPLEKLEQISAHHLSILNRRETLTNWPRWYSFSDDPSHFHLKPKLESVPADVLSNSSSPEMPGEAYTAKKSSNLYAH